MIGTTTDNSYKLNVNGGFYGSYFKGGDSGSGSVIANFVNVFGTSAMYVRGDSRVGIGTTQPQKPLEVISGANDFVSVGVNQISPGAWTGIHFGYREDNNSYRKSAIVFQRTDLTANDAQGKVHILNGPQGGPGSATLSDARLTIAENGNVGISNTSPSERLHVTGNILASGDITAFSDASVKTNIRPIKNVLERINKSRGVLYDRIDTEVVDNIGFIAQELEETFPELVTTNEEGNKAVKYQNATAILFEAVKEQQRQIEELKELIKKII
jgi:hypothetical protein